MESMGDVDPMENAGDDSNMDYGEEENGEEYSEGYYQVTLRMYICIFYKEMKNV